MADSHEDGVPLGERIGRIAAAMLKLDPGQLASLRRMKPDSPGELAFWELATKFGLRTDDKSLLIVKLMALLAPKGDVGTRSPFHDFDQHLGGVLFAVRYPEPRLARFLALPFERRGEGLESIVRYIAGKSTGQTVDCAEIARLLFSDDVKYRRRLARDYYSASNKAAATDKDNAA